MKNSVYGLNRPKRFLAASTLLAILSSLLPTAALASASFSDLDGSDPSFDAIQYMQTSGTIEGYPDGSFRSTENINRAEFVKILVGTLVEEPTGENCFSDVTTEWFAPYVCTAKDLGLIEGHPDGTFKPADYINFAEASKVITNAFDLNLASVSSDDPWYRTYVEPIAGSSAIPFSITDFDKEIARGEMAEVIWRLDTEETELSSLVYEELEGIPVMLDSCDEFVDLFVSQHTDDYWGYDYWEDEEIAESSSDTSGADADDIASSVSSDSDDVAYSTTNVQEYGVDESDIVKNDGSHVYLIDGDYVKIIQAYPVEDMTQVGTLDYSGNYGYLDSLYLDGDTLIVMFNAYDDDWNDITQVDRFDVSDPSNPSLERTLKFDGDLSNSRKVDDTLYLILEQYQYDFPYYDEEEDYSNAEIIESYIPHFVDSLESETEEYTMATCEDIAYLPRYRDYNYLITAAVPLADDGDVDFEIMMGSADNVYSSKDNLYIADLNYDYNDYYLDWDNTKTILHRFSLGDADIEYESSGKVPGTIHDQFSMSEHDSHLRVATTTGNLWNGSSSNHLYILNEDMDQTGSLEDLAAGEEIYSARMFGDRGYIVTFKKVDPLFVLDLSDPENPKVEGELKIPGYSDYLHPFGEDYLIGFGKDAEEATEEETLTRDLDFAWFQGLKLSLFDITDVNNPTQIASYGIGDRGTDSPLTYNHKALTASLDTESLEGWLAFPVELAELENPEEADANDWGDTTYQGLFVLDISVEDGISERGRVTHFSDEQLAEDYFYGWGDEAILRSLYIDDVIYSVSEAQLGAHALDSLEDLGSVDIGSDNYDDWYWYED